MAGPVTINDKTNTYAAVVDSSGALKVTGSFTATNPSVGTTGATAPTSATEVGWIDGSGNLVGISAGTPLPVSASVTVAETVLNVTGTIGSAAVLSNFPVNPTTGYRSAAVQVTNAGSTCTLVAEESNDGTTWTGCQALYDTTVEVATPMTTVGRFLFNITALQFRIRCSVYGSGNPAVNVEFRQNPTNASTVSYLTQINTTLGTPMQSTGGTVGLVAGTALIGKAGIDQTTQGSTNAVLPPTANLASGANSTTGATTTQLIAAVTAKKIYCVGWSFSNSSATAVTVAFQDGSGGSTLHTIIVPAGGGNNVSGDFPFFSTTAGNGLYFIVSSGVSTVYGAGSGYAI